MFEKVAESTTKLCELPYSYTIDNRENLLDIEEYVLRYISDNKVTYKKVQLMVQNSLRKYITYCCTDCEAKFPSYSIRFVELCVHEKYTIYISDMGLLIQYKNKAQLFLDISSIEYSDTLICIYKNEKYVYYRYEHEVQNIMLPFVCKDVENIIKEYARSRSPYTTDHVTMINSMLLRYFMHYEEETYHENCKGCLEYLEYLLSLYKISCL